MTVLASYVPDAQGGDVLELALIEARLRGCPIEVLNVAIGADFADPTFADESDLDAVRARLNEAGVPCHIRQVLDAFTVADVVLAVADAIDAELIVIGLHGKATAGIPRIGGTARRVLLAARCPVMTVRPSAA